MPTDLPVTPYHIGPQSAAALLGPIVRDVAELEARLAHYHDRLHMPEADRAAIARARDALAAARTQLNELA
jgi:hypothetical protein